MGRHPTKLWRALPIAAVGVLTFVGLTTCTPETPESTSSTPRPASTSQQSPTQEPAHTPQAPAPEVAWSPPQLSGYALSDDPPASSVVQLDNAATGCILQLSHEPLAADVAGDDGAYTDAALDSALSSFGEATETDRQDAMIRTDHGDLPATQVDVDATSGGQQLSVRMLLRASTAAGALVGIVHLCPPEAEGDEVWRSAVEGAVLSGVPPTAL